MQAKPLQQRSNVAVAFLVFTIAAAALSLWADLNQYDVVSRIADGKQVSLSEVKESDHRFHSTALVYTVANVLSAVTFLLWYNRAYRNVIALRLNPRYSPRWAVASWFIPILNLFRPKQVLNDMWRASSTNAPEPGELLGERPVSLLLHWWWAVWLFDLFLSRVAFRSTFSGSGLADSLDALQNRSAGYIAVDLVDMVAGVLAILVVWQLTLRVSALPAAGGPVFDADYRPSHDPEIARAVASTSGPADAPAIFCPRCGHQLQTAIGACPECRMETQPAGGPISDPSQSSDARKRARRRG